MPWSVEMGPLFGAPYQRSTMHDQRIFYCTRGTVFAPLCTFDVSRLNSLQASQTTGDLVFLRPRARENLTGPTAG